MLLYHMEDCTFNHCPYLIWSNGHPEPWIEVASESIWFGFGIGFEPRTFGYRVEAMA